MATRAIRGATTVKENKKESILNETSRLLRKMLEENNIMNGDIISIIFTVTKDLDAAFPAAAARALGIVHAALLDFPQHEVRDALKMCVRVMMYADMNVMQSEVKHIYLNGAKILRKDLVEEENKIAVALDGPAGSGKSTIAKLVAKKLGLTYIDTGAMYRSVALYCIDKDIDYNNEVDVISELENMNIGILSANKEQRYILNGEDVTELIRSPEVSEGASRVATYKAVREKLVAIQRELASKQSVIMDGRDIGTNVLPNAEIKIFMDGDVEERAKRRYEELSLKGISVTYDEILSDIKQRDHNDSSRAYNPLRKADDAILLDTTNMSIEEVGDFIIGKIDDVIKKD